MGIQWIGLHLDESLLLLVITWSMETYYSHVLDAGQDALRVGLLLDEDLVDHRSDHILGSPHSCLAGGVEELLSRLPQETLQVIHRSGI